MNASRRFHFFAISGVALSTLAYFLFLQRSTTFADPDSFYHVRMALLVAQQGVVTHFPWLAFTGLTTFYTDQHYLYHVALVPFVRLAADPLQGAKVATAVLNAAFFAVVTAMLLRFRIRLWWAAIGVLLVTNPFLFRIDLVKAPTFSLLFLFVGMWMLFAGRKWPLAIVSFLYAWAYGGFLLLPLAAVIYAGVVVLQGWGRASLLYRWFGHGGRIFSWGAVWRTRAVRAALFSLGGAALGFVVNPYFPKNIAFTWQQLVQIGIVNFQHVVNVGGEWRPYGFIALVSNTVFVSIAVLLALVGLLVLRKKQSSESWTLLVLTALFFALTLKSRRYVELYVPVAVLFAAFVSRDAFAGRRLREMWRHALRTLSRRPVPVIAFALYVALTSMFIIVRDTTGLNRDLQAGIPFKQFGAATAWLAENTPEGSIVVHSDWDEFPQLFYGTTHNRFIVGLDPTFMYVHDRLLYERWANLTMGARTADATQIITHDLRSGIVFVAKDHAAFMRTMEAQTAFEKAYEDADAVIFTLRRPLVPTP